MNDSVEWLICLILSLAILANAFVVKRSVGSWAFPAVIFSLFWFAYTFVPLVSFPEIHVYPIGMLYIFGASIAFSLGSFGPNWRTRFRDSRRIKRPFTHYYGSPLLLISFGAGLLITVACLIVNITIQGISLDRLSDNLTDVASEYAQRRYTFDLVSNVYQQLSNIFAYFCSGVGGLIFTEMRTSARKLIVATLSFFPAIFVMLTQSAKGMLFLSMAIFFGGLIISRFQHGQTSLFSKRAFFVGLVSVVILVPLVTLSFLARGLQGSDRSELWDVVAPYWASYTSGHLFAFSDWFGNYLGLPSYQFYRDPDLSFGFYTFMAVFRLFGDSRYVPLGIYDEFLIIPPFISSNIYTIFRGLILDFGIPGSLLALSAMSWVIHRFFRTVLMSPTPAFSAAAMIFSIALIYQSFTASSLTWITLPLGLLLVGIVLFLVKVSALSAPRPSVLRQTRAARES